MAIIKRTKSETPAAPAADPRAAAQTVDPRFKVKKHVNVQSWKWEDGVTKYFTVLDPIHKGKTFEDKSGKRVGKYDAPADIINVTDLADGLGTVRVVTLGKVLKDMIEEQYPDASYVGKSFAVTRLAKEQGKRYHLYTCDEIEVK